MAAIYIDDLKVDAPPVGLGVWQVAPAATQELVSSALKLGYRLFDTAQGYLNEREVGAAVMSAEIDRREIRVTTKIQGIHHGYHETVHSLMESLKSSGLAYFDQVLIHWPLPKKNKYLETWNALIECRARGLCREIGVSNFNVNHVDRLFHETKVMPDVNQIEIHPYFQQRLLRQQLGERGIRLESASPFARGAVFSTRR